MIATQADSCGSDADCGRCSEPMPRSDLSRRLRAAWNESAERSVDMALHIRRLLGFVPKQSPSVVDVEFAKPYRTAPSTHAWVMCLSGTAWLTRDGCRADTILSQGDVERVSREEHPLIVGMPRCRLRMFGKQKQLAERHETATA